MINRKACMSILVGTGVALIGPIGLTGCGSEEEQEVVRDTAPPPPPENEKPKSASVEDLIGQYGIDPRVNLAEDDAPDDESERVALLEFFDGFARGDEQVVRRKLSSLDQRELDAMIETGQWDEATESIDRIDIMQTDNVDGDLHALAIIDANGDFQPQLWRLVKVDGDFEFEAVPTPPGMMDLLGGTDQIAAWREILEEEMALAYENDEGLEVPQFDRSLTDHRDGPSNAPDNPDGPDPIPMPNDPGDAPSNPTNPISPH